MKVMRETWARKKAERDILNEEIEKLGKVLKEKDLAHQEIKKELQTLS